MSRLPRKLKQVVGAPLKRLRALRDAMRTCARRASGNSDRARWSDLKNLTEDWDYRTQELARIIPPGSRVLEFGAGRRTLERHLPPGCRYFPSDLVERGPDTLVCDLNAPPYPEFPAHDVAVFSGVLEYIHDVPGLASHLSLCSGTVLVSYAAYGGGGLGEKVERRAMGWVNDFTADEVRQIFTEAGYHCAAMTAWKYWEAHKLYRFERQRLGEPTSASAGDETPRGFAVRPAQP